MAETGTTEAGWVRAAVVAVARHPSLWVTGVRQARVLAAPGWWRRRPFLPLPGARLPAVPPADRLRRDGDSAPEPDDLVTYLRWVRDLR